MYVPSAPRFPSPSAPLRAALESLPGYAARVAANAALKAPQAAARAALQEAEATLDRVASELATGLLGSDASDSSDLIQSSTAKAAEATASKTRAAAAVELLEAVETIIGVDLDNIIRTSADRLLKHLDRTLKDAYAKSHSLGLEDIHHAEEAIAQGKSDAWASMIELRTIIFQCRTAQSDIIGKLGTLENIQRLSTFGSLENYAALDPTFLARRTSARWGNQHLTAPWPTQSDGSIDPTDMHAYILAHPDEARPWIPTESQLTNAIKTAELEARAALAEQDA